MNTEALTCKEI